jgi:hypothetical protein
MAARFACFNPDMLNDVVFWASYPTSDNDLSGRDLHVVTVYGSQDGLTTVEKVRPLSGCYLKQQSRPSY